MVLLGPSGCGKSTTLRMIAGLEAITSGELRIDDQVMNRIPAKDRDIAMVFQSYALYPHMNVRDNLAFGLRRRNVPRDEIRRRVETAAAMLGLETLLERKPYALSGGQRQRVALGRAIVRDPKVFLFDEPLSNLDAALRVRTRGELIQQHQRLGATMIYVTHDQVEAMTMGTRICVMNHGRVVQVGRPLEVYRDPADTFVAAFIGSPPANLLAADVAEADGAVAVRVAGRELALPRHRAADVAALEDRRVVFGIRPEDIDVRAAASVGAADGAELPARLVAVEPLGAETILVLALDGLGEEIIARVGPEVALRPGERVALELNLRAAHLFDPRSTRALPRTGPES
ncbi:MAG: glycerol-3-phosphate transporter ATP-binding protein [Geminicoccaceae bacterium]|nr:glycerol-3-phosphate transporter ATP-binding protein [Geminicoccaceae bacterium]